LNDQRKPSSTVSDAPQALAAVTNAGK
jgi:hypothetical protein